MANIPLLPQYGGFSTPANSGTAAGSYGSDSTANAFNTTGTVTDPNTGATVSGTLMVPTSKGPMSIQDLVLQSRDPKNLAAIKANLVKYGLISKTTKSLTSIQNAWINVLVNSATSKMDPQKYMQALKTGGFGADTTTGTTTSGTRAYPTITNPTDAEASIQKVFQDKLGRIATPAEIKKFTNALNSAEATNPTKVTYSATGQKTTGGLNTDQFLADEIQKDSSLKKEADTILLQSPDVTKRLADKKIYDQAVAATGGDLAKITALKETTAYGRGLKEYETFIQDKALNVGALNDPAEIAALAKGLYDKGFALNSETAQSQIDAALKFGANKEGKYTGKAATIVADLQATARANGLDLNKNFGSQVQAFLSDINRGEPVDNIKQKIREVAKLGQPDNIKKLIDNGIDLETIYSPYKKTLASTLEINPETITLDDPTLRAAITPQGEMNIYDYQKMLRKDHRWQYTQQANGEVADATKKILQDFGFQG